MFTFIALFYQFLLDRIKNAQDEEMKEDVAGEQDISESKILDFYYSRLSEEK